MAICDTHSAAASCRLQVSLISLAVILVCLIGFSGVSTKACTVFLASDSNLVLAGNNEDFKDTMTIVGFFPRDSSKFGRVMFGFEEAFPQGGVNERGLFFDGLAVDKLEIKTSAGRPDYYGFLAEKALEECATVDEVIALFSQYDIAWLEYAQLMFGDRSGNSVIIEGDSLIVNRGGFQVATNFYQSQVSKDSITCDRYLTASRMLESSDSISIGLFRQILDSTHAEGRFQSVYSNIYDLSGGLVYLYRLHDFENNVVIEIDNELSEGHRRVALRTLFEQDDRR